MALSTVLNNRTHRGNRRVRHVDITFDNSYATGGEAFLPADCDLTTFDAVVLGSCVLAGAHSSHRVAHDRVNNKLQVFTVVGVEIANAVDLSTFVVRAMVEGQ